MVHKCYLTDLQQKGEITIMVNNDGFLKTGEAPNPASEVNPKTDFTPKKPKGERVTTR